VIFTTEGEVLKIEVKGWKKFQFCWASYWADCAAPATGTVFSRQVSPYFGNKWDLKRWFRRHRQIDREATEYARGFKAGRFDNQF
jgi:hypothetical protein